MIFEFDKAVVVVEVTLTSSSRQEAAEGEPVRRHVAMFKEKATKPVYGLFIAIDIDSNTAHTFKSGDWYLPDDKKISLDIVPLRLEDFSMFLDSHKERLHVAPANMIDLLVQSRAKANQDAPQCKKEITGIVQGIDSV